MRKEGLEGFSHHRLTHALCSLLSLKDMTNNLGLQSLTMFIALTLSLPWLRSKDLKSTICLLGTGTSSDWVKYPSRDWLGINTTFPLFPWASKVFPVTPIPSSPLIICSLSPFLNVLFLLLIFSTIFPLLIMSLETLLEGLYSYLFCYYFCWAYLHHPLALLKPLNYF